MYHSEDQAPACIRAFGMHPCCVLASCVNAHKCVYAPPCACVSQHTTYAHALPSTTPYRNYGRRCHEVSSAARTWSAHRRGVRCMCVHEHAHAHCWYLRPCAVCVPLHVHACACVYIYVHMHVCMSRARPLKVRMMCARTRDARAVHARPPTQAMATTSGRAAPAICRVAYLPPPA